MQSIPLKLYRRKARDVIQLTAWRISRSSHGTCSRMLARNILRQVKSATLWTSVPNPLPTSVPLRCWTSGAEEKPSTGNHVTVNLDKETGIATVRLNRPPVNTLTMEFLTEVSIALNKLHDERLCCGLILTSTIQGIFSGGLDINEMYQPSIERLGEVWRLLQEVWTQLYGSNLVTMAAVNGHAPAGGCLLALSCDYRLMAKEKYTIGLNGAHLGIVPPLWLQRVMAYTVGQREAERCIGVGHLYTPAEALQAGLVDRVVPSDQLQRLTEAEMARWLHVPDVARQLTKSTVRKDALALLLSSRERDADSFINYVCQDSVQRLLGDYLERLKNKHSKV